MGSMTNQWVKTGRGERNREYGLQNVKVYSGPAHVSWAKNRGLALELRAYFDQKYQQVFLTTEESEKLASDALGVCRTEKRIELIRSVLRDLSDPELLPVLSSLLKSRPKVSRQLSREGLGRSLRKYTVIYEQGPRNWSASVPDLPGCIATAKTRPLLEKQIREAIELHIDGLLQQGEDVPEPSTAAGMVDVVV